MSDQQNVEQDVDHLLGQEIGVSPEVVVRARFVEADITPSADEIALFTAIYPLLRARVDRIYELDFGDRP